MNLESICAKYGHAIIEPPAGALKHTDQENTITKALGVLAENGIYAMCVFLLSCNKKEYGERILKKLFTLWTSQDVALVPAQNNPSKAQMLTAVRANITEDLSKLILAKRLTEQTLIFARYHAKAEVSGGANP